MPALRFSAPFKPFRYALAAFAMVGLAACMEGEPLDLSNEKAISLMSSDSSAVTDGSVDSTRDVSAGANEQPDDAEDKQDAVFVTGATITLDWEKPLSNVDGTILIDLAGYRIHWGTAPGVYTESIDVEDPEATSFTMNKPSPGTYYFAASAYDSDANEGPRSNIASVVIN